MTNRKSHKRFRLVPKSATLDDLERTLFQNTCGFGAHQENSSEDRLTLSAAKMRAKTKVYRDNRGGSLEMGRKTTVGLSKTAMFSTFSLYFFRSFRGKTNIIIYRQPG